MENYTNKNVHQNAKPHICNRTFRHVAPTRAFETATLNNLTCKMMNSPKCISNNLNIHLWACLEMEGIPLLECLLF